MSSKLAVFLDVFAFSFFRECWYEARGTEGNSVGVSAEPETKRRRSGVAADVARFYGRARSKGAKEMADI